MKIGEVAAQAGVNIQTVRYYERRGLLRDPGRSESGFRRYDATAVRAIQFIRRAQLLGFTLGEIRDLVPLGDGSAHACGAVKAQASATLERIDARIAELSQMRDGLRVYVSACDDRAAERHCPLLTGLSHPGEVNLESVQIELIYDRDCPNVDRARQMIASALREVNAGDQWTEWDRESPDTPQSRRKYGSPTVLVNGRDVGCDENGDTTADAKSCRVYIDAHGACLCGAPSSRLIVDAIYAALSSARAVEPPQQPFPRRS